MHRRIVITLCLALLASAAYAEEKLEVGGKAPDFKAIGVDGKEYSLGSMSDAKAVVVCFTCNSCPVAVAYEDRFIEFAKEYKSKGIEFIAINVNPETEDAMKARAEEKGFTFPYAKDDSGDSARSYGARVTPHIFVLDKNRSVAYVGAFDDNTAGDKAGKHYVKDAVDALLAGKKPEVTETRPVGCGIRPSR